MLCLMGARLADRPHGAARVDRFADLQPTPQLRLAAGVGRAGCKARNYHLLIRQQRNADQNF
jgi:hypothetical protein